MPIISRLILTISIMELEDDGIARPPARGQAGTLRPRVPDVCHACERTEQLTHFNNPSTGSQKREHKDDTIFLILLTPVRNKVMQPDAHYKA